MTFLKSVVGAAVSVRAYFATYSGVRFLITGMNMAAFRTVMVGDSRDGVEPSDIGSLTLKVSTDWLEWEGVRFTDRSGIMGLGVLRVTSSLKWPQPFDLS